MAQARGLTHLQRANLMGGSDKRFAATYSRTSNKFYVSSHKKYWRIVKKIPLLKKKLKYLLTKSKQIGKQNILSLVTIGT